MVLLEASVHPSQLAHRIIHDSFAINAPTSYLVCTNVINPSRDRSRSESRIREDGLVLGTRHLEYRSSIEVFPFRAVANARQ